MKIRKRKSKKRYLGEKKVYEYERLSLDFPAEFGDAIEPFLNKDLEMTVKKEADDTLVIVLTPPRKRFGTPNHPPTKHSQNTIQNLNFNMKMQFPLKCRGDEEFAYRTFRHAETFCRGFLVQKIV